MPKTPKSAKRLYEPNLIAELREERGWSQEDLAEVLEEEAHLKTSSAQIGKLERRERQLTVRWMTALSKAFGVEQIDLLDIAAMSGATNDVEPHDGGSHALALAQRGLRYYDVVSDACAEGGYPAGKTVLVDASEATVSSRQSGAFVLVQTRPGKDDSLLLLRVWIAPGLLVTNRASSNTAMKLGKNRIVGVVVPENNIPS